MWDADAGGGSSSLEGSALRGARLLVEAGIPEVKLRVTVTAENVDRLQAFSPVAAELGVHRVVVKAFDQVGVAGAGGTPLAISRPRYEEAVARLEAAWPPDGVPLSCSQNMPSWSPKFTQLIPSFGCVGGTTSATVLPDGSVVACGCFPTPQDWTLHNHTFTECWLGSETIDRWRHLEPNEQCRTCANLEACGGGGRARATGAGRGFLAPDPWAECGLYEPAEHAAPAPPPIIRPASGLRALPMAR